MIGNTTMHHLINDSLMPELKTFQDEKIFRNLWQDWRTDIAQKNPVFIHPKKAFDFAGLSFSSDLQYDWDELKHLSNQISIKPPLHKLSNFFPLNHQLQFFTSLLWPCLHIQFYGIPQLLRAEPSIQHQQYILMRYLMDLEQLMADNEQRIKTSSHPIVRKTYQQLMYFFWLRYERTNQDLWHPKSLRYFKEDLTYHLKQTEGDNALSAYLIDQLQEAPPKRIEEFSKIAPLDIAEGIKKDLNDMKETMKHLQPPLQMEQDVYLRPKDAAKLLGIATSTLAKWRVAGKLKKIRNPANRYEYSRKEILRLLEG